MDSQARSLQSLADQISAKTGVAVILDHAVASQSVSVSFQGLALDEGLRRIFKNNDAFYFYGSDKGEPPALKVVWVYAKGKARGLQPVPPDKWASTKELERLLTDPDPQVRGWAIETLVERNREAALRQVLNSLKDNDDQVRTRALYGATVAGVPVPEGVLNNLALSDPSADVRFLALQGLSNSNSPDARQIAQHALNDPSEPVRLEAREIITRLDEEADQSQQRTPSSADQQQSNQSPQNL